MGEIQLSAQSLAETYNYLRVASLVEPKETADQHEIAIFEKIVEQTSIVREYIQQIGLPIENAITAKQVMEKMGGDYFTAPPEILSICTDITNKMVLFVAAHNKAVENEF